MEERDGCMRTKGEEEVRRENAAKKGLSKTEELKEIIVKLLEDYCSARQIDDRIENSPWADNILKACAEARLVFFYHPYLERKAWRDIKEIDLQR